jgi:hypothetical protein
MAKAPQSGPPGPPPPLSQYAPGWPHPGPATTSQRPSRGRSILSPSHPHDPRPLLPPPLSLAPLSLSRTFCLLLPRWLRATPAQTMVRDLPERRRLLVGAPAAASAAVPGAAARPAHGGGWRGRLVPARSVGRPDCLLSTRRSRAPLPHLRSHRPPPPAMHRVDIARSGRHGPGSPSPVATARGGSDSAGRARARRGGRPCAASSLPFVGGGARGRLRLPVDPVELPAATVNSTRGDLISCYPAGRLALA